MSDNVTAVSAEDILPVGMLANGRGPAKAMESVAKRKMNVPGWEPFHYEQISATEFEVTGGLPEVVGGAKRWPEPHTTVIVLEGELTKELQLSTSVEASFDDKKTAITIHPKVTLSSNVAASSPHTQHTKSQSRYMTVILRMPDDAAGHQRIVEMLALNKNFFGADVVATAFQDDVMVSKSLQIS
ncbi:hypothetical protein RGU75_18550 [Glaciimonas sp. CA11.2]|uniref:hypothetical protein n=1 Tax=Glaciimonas sp. CA11.2 TaxID=3048601 RepID=UPI002AB4CA64|nr:hypothetical protein [Glaciimonas sp. CA11.2]MDY7548216.1 hypothetical protein [Glaciimonas sp. CA11.2]